MYHGRNGPRIPPHSSKPTPTGRILPCYIRKPGCFTHFCDEHFLQKMFRVFSENLQESRQTFCIHPQKLTWIPKMMVWKRWLRLQILKFLEGKRSKNTLYSRYEFNKKEGMGTQTVPTESVGKGASGRYGRYIVTHTGTKYVNMYVYLYMYYI